jgi:hypothetical protein
MRITKILFPLSLFLNFIILLALFNYGLNQIQVGAETVAPKKFPVLLVQKNATNVEALNLSQSPITLDNLVIPPATIQDGKVQLTRLTKVPEPTSFTWNKNSFSFPSEYAKISPEISKLDEEPHCPICLKTKNEWIIPKGKHQADSILKIPGKLKFVLKAGAQITFSSNGGIFSRSPVSIEGTSAEPVILKGEDWKGFTVLSPESSNHVSYLEASGGKGFDYNGMRFTGMINFITGDYKIHHLKIHDSRAEDGINLKWTTGTLADVTITQSFSDGIDIDWSEIKVSRLSIVKTGNDCLDLSGGRIQATQLSLSECSDKAVSNGESNYLELDDTKIFNSKTGIANKDGATIKINNLVIKDSQSILSQYLGKHFYSEPVTEFQSKPVSINTGKASITSGKVSGHEAL